MAQAPASMVPPPQPAATLDIELTPAPTPRPRRRGLWITFGSLGLVLGLGIAYGTVGLVTASQSVDTASSAIRATLEHQKTVIATLDADPFKNIDFNAEPPDVAGARTALAAFEPKLAPSLAIDRADRSSLQAARRRLSSSFLTLPEQGMLADQRRRVDAAIAGLDAADQQLAWRQDQVNFLHPFFDSIDGWVAIDKAASANDAVGIAAQLQVIANNQARLASLAKAPAIPPQAIALVGTLQKTLDDIHGLLNAAQASDEAAFTRYQAAVTADGKTLADIDTGAIETYEKQLFDPLTTKYNQEMQLAATGQ